MSETTKARSSWPRVSAPTSEQIEREKTEAIRLQDVQAALHQYEEGAITFVEFVMFATSRITQQDWDEHNAYLAQTDDNAN